MCDHVPVEYRYETVKRAVDTAACTVLVLCGVLGMTIAVLGVAYPASTGSVSPSWGNIVPVFCIGTGLAYVGFAVARRTLTGCLTVTSDGLVLRDSGCTAGSRRVSQNAAPGTTSSGAGSSRCGRSAVANLMAARPAAGPSTSRR
jgi:hypothetical protein